MKIPINSMHPPLKADLNLRILKFFQTSVRGFVTHKLKYVNWEVFLAQFMMLLLKLAGWLLHFGYESILYVRDERCLEDAINFFYLI